MTLLHTFKRVGSNDKLEITGKGGGVLFVLEFGELPAPLAIEVHDELVDLQDRVITCVLRKADDGQT